MCLNFLVQLNLGEFATRGAAFKAARARCRVLFAEEIGAAAVPAVVRIVYEANPRDLERRPAPPPDRLCDQEQVADLDPVVVEAVPSVSLPLYGERLSGRCTVRRRRTPRP